jgi:hypothetical protein
LPCDDPKGAWNSTTTAMLIDVDQFLVG